MATIKDVAREAGVAVETVSRVLNNRGYISDKTRHKVYEAMDILGYRPNAIARGLSKQDTDTIAVIVPQVVHPYFAKMISRIEKECTRRHYKLFLYNSSGDRQKESSVLSLCQSSYVTGVMLFSPGIRPEVLKRFDIPIITIERAVEGGTSNIMVDNLSGGSMAAEHLISKGCKKMIVFSSSINELMPGDDREAGFVSVCSRANVSCRVYRSHIEEFETMEYYDLIRVALQENPDVDGIFATSDVVAAQVIQVANSLGRKIPDDIKLVGFDDVELSRMISPTLTTIHQPIREMVGMVVDMIEDARAGKPIPPRQVLPVRLIERESTATSDTK